MSQAKNIKLVAGMEEVSDAGFAGFKTPTDEPHLNGTDKDESTAGSADLPKSKIQTRSQSAEKPKIADESKPDLPETVNHGHNTRSRSITPQQKATSQEINKDLVETVSEESEINIVNDEVNPPTATVDELQPDKKDVVVADKDDDMPELVFDENDTDIESEGSPNRCKTRRSEVPSVSTPKTPRLIEDEELLLIDLNETTDQDTSDTQSSVSGDNNSSTIAVADSDNTRSVDLTQESEFVDEHVYASPDYTLSFKETLKNISRRRTIRPISPLNYRKCAMVNTFVKHNDIPAAIADYDLVQRVSGVKRKSTSIPLNEPKKLKRSSGLLNYITLPIYTLKNSFTATSEPNIDHGGKESDVEYENKKIDVDAERKPERRWCSIM